MSASILYIQHIYNSNFWLQIFCNEVKINPAGGSKHAITSWAISHVKMEWILNILENVTVPINMDCCGR
jgi:hypothetical protein